jgi:hypothetical protein
MQTSGQTSAQIAHPVQSSGRAKTAVAYPWRLTWFPISITPLGQAGTQSSHALHLSRSISILPVALAALPFIVSLALHSYFGLNSK